MDFTVSSWAPLTRGWTQKCATSSHCCLLQVEPKPSGQCRGHLPAGMDGVRLTAGEGISLNTRIQESVSICLPRFVFYNQKKLRCLRSHRERGAAPSHEPRARPASRPDSRLRPGFALHKKDCLAGTGSDQTGRGRPTGTVACTPSPIQSSDR